MLILAAGSRKSSPAVALVVITTMTYLLSSSSSSPSKLSMIFAKAFVQRGGNKPTKLYKACTATKHNRWSQFLQTEFLSSSKLSLSSNSYKNCLRITSVSLERRTITARCLSTEDSSNHHDSDNRKPTNSLKETKKSTVRMKKWKVNESIQSDDAADKLAAAFDELARNEGFDSSLSYLANDTGFEEDFEFVDDNNNTSGSKEDEFGDKADILDPRSFDISDFAGFNDDIDNETPSKVLDDEYLDLGGDIESDVDDMEARIAAAKRDVDIGRVTIPAGLDDFADAASDVDLRKLGFERELNPFGDDETPRKQQFKIISNAMTCSACGSEFQSRDEKKPGFLPPEKFEIQTKLSRIEEMQDLMEKADSDEWSVEDEVEFLIQTSGGDGDDVDGADVPGSTINIDQMAEELGLDLVQLASKKVICKRCHGLQNFGKVDESLRPGWSNEPAISQQKFRELLRPISQKPAVIVALVDLFDFTGSVLRELDGIAGDNPVILAANKVDLLPNQMGRHRVENWVRRELEYIGVKSLANVGGAVRLISCKTGTGVFEMLQKARSIADDMDCDVYVVGAANAGKSTLINHILGYDENKKVGKIRAGNRNAFKGALTTSPLPGTTLKFIKVDLGDGKNLIDTPGLLVPGTLTQILTPEELKIVVPKK